MSYHSKQFSDKYLEAEKLFSFKRYFMNNADSYHGLSVLNEVSKVLLRNVSPPSVSDTIVGEDVTPRPPPPPELPYEIYGKKFIIWLLCICTICISYRYVATKIEYENLKRNSVSGLTKHMNNFRFLLSLDTLLHGVHMYVLIILLATVLDEKDPQTEKTKGMEKVAKIIPKDKKLVQTMLTCGTVILDISYDREEAQTAMEYLKCKYIREFLLI